MACFEKKLNSTEAFGLALMNHLVMCLNIEIYHIYTRPAVLQQVPVKLDN